MNIADRQATVSSKSVEDPDAHARRPRDSGRIQAVQRAVLDLVAAVGIDGVTIDAVAAAAKVSKSTVYRLWPTKAHLIREAILMSFGGEQPHDPGDRGSLRDELLIVLEGAATVLRQNPKLMIALADGAQRDAEIFIMLRQETRERLREATQRPLLRAIARGDIEPDVDIDLVPDVALPIMLDRAIWHEPIDDQFLAYLVDRVLIPIATASPS